MANQDAGGAVKLPDATQLQLAVDRTRLAHERTLMAWVRTATSMISFGFTIYTFFQFMHGDGKSAPPERLINCTGRIAVLPTGGRLLRRKQPLKAIINTLLLTAAIWAVALTAHAAEVGHFNGGLANIRDYVVPEPGIYGLLYNYFYTTDRLNDRHGDAITSVIITPRGGREVTLGVEVNVDLYALAPVFIWVTDLKPLGLPLKYGAAITLPFANASVGAALSTATGRGGTVDTASFNVGDMFVQPVWLGLTLPHWDVAFGYGFYAPTGTYNTETVTLRGGQSITAEAPDNIGLGFWTHQLQGAVAWYPWTHKATAITAALTYEMHHNKADFDLTPGQNLTLNWGISQFLPLTKDQKLLLEVGPAGYSSWQISNDTGSDARNGQVHDQLHGVGGQLGLNYLPWQAVLTFHAFYEFAAQDRFQGQAFGFNLGKKF